MSLAYNHAEIVARELKPALFELDGISRQTIEAHYKLYQGYVAKRNEILGRLAGVDLAAANQTYSELRELKVELTFAIGGIKNHELYFEHLGGVGGEPKGAFGALVTRDFGSVDAWRADLKATGIAGRGWAWTAYDWDEGRLFNYIGDAQNTFPVWNASPLVGARRLRARVLHRLRHRPLRVHRRLLREPRLQRDRRLGRGVRHSPLTFAAIVVGGYLLGSCPWGYWLPRIFRGDDVRRSGSGSIGGSNVWRTYGPKLGIPVILLDALKGFVPALVGVLVVSHLCGIVAGAAAMLGHARPLYLRFEKGGKMVATGGGVLFAVCPWVALAAVALWIVIVRAHALHVGGLDRGRACAAGLPPLPSAIRSR